MLPELTADFLHNLLDVLKNPLLYADTRHVVRYLNKAAKDFYSGGEKLLGSNLLDCHNPQSQRQMIDILQKMKQGLEEELRITKSGAFICVPFDRLKEACWATTNALNHPGEDKLDAG